MASSGNFATWNQLANVNPGISYSDFVLDKGNIRFRGNTGGTATITSSLSMPSGKWYIEIYAENNPAGGWPALGILKTQSISKLQNVSNFQTYSSSQANDRSVVIGTDGDIYKFGSTTNGIAGGVSWSDGDVLQIAVDIDNGKWYFGKNGTYSNSSVPASGTNPVDTFTAGTEMSVFVASYNGSSYMYINAGQDSTFGGEISAGGNADDNGFGDFKYSPPTGFLALCSANLPISDDIDPAQTDDDFPQKNFNVVTYTGNGSTINVTGLGFQPDLVWIKMRSAHTYNNMLFDSNRGVYKSINSDRTNLEYNLTNALSSFDSDGFTYGNELSGNDSGDSFVAWCWKANGGTTASNSDGSITTTLQVGKGFSIGTYTGTGSNATVGHGLGAVPDFTLFKRRDASGNWVATSQKNMSSNDHNLYLQLDNAQSDGNYFQNTAMTSSVISIGTHSDINGSSNTYVMYNWINVEGYQKFGTYIGHGNADGPFIYTGFRPRMIFVKLLDSAGDWWIQDSARSTFNPLSKYLAWNRTDTEATGIDVDFLSNGFKIRTSSGDFNSNGAEILYGAWGDVPFKYNNTF